MFCTAMAALGIAVASCSQPVMPERDRAAEILIEQEAERQADFDAAMAKRAKLYEGLGECPDCGKMKTYPFPKGD